MKRLREHINRLRQHDEARLWFSIVVCCILVALFIGTLHRFRRQARQETNTRIAHDVETLRAFFRRIDESCTIVGFNLEKTPINFLTVQSFVGPEVGSMRLAYPHNWQGPYVQSNITLQGKYYAVLATQQGYYIVPGDGVRLSDGRVIGKDVHITSTTPLDSLIGCQGSLIHQGIPLVAHIPLKNTATSLIVQFEKELLDH
jgi:hypothetical protein